MPSKDYLGDQIPQQIAGDIILGRIFPGEKLTEISLCEGFKVSRTPVREALMLLEKQGFVENSKNAGATVGKGTQEKLLEMERHVADGDFGRHMECNIEFHNSIMKKCPNEELSKSLRELNERIRFYRRGGLAPRPRDLQKRLDAHRRIIGAIWKSDAPRARRLLGTHVQ